MFAQYVDYVNQIGRKPYYDPRQYNFLPQAPGTTLSAGSVTISLAPVPLGLNGTDSGHYVYISGGTGTAETCLITGGTAVAGAATGTITCTVANSHSGAWTVGPATAGVQEALQAACTASAAAVRIPAGNLTWRGRLTAPCSASVRGAGMQVTTITMASGYTDRAVEVITPAGAYWDFGDMTIIYTTNGTTNEALYIQEVTDGVISNMDIVNPYNAVTGYGIGRVHFDHLNLFPRNNGYSFSSNSGSGVIAVAVPIITNTYLTMQAGVGAGMNLGPTTAGIVINGFDQALGADGISVIQSSGATNEVSIQNSIIDSVSNQCIDLNLTSTASASRWTVANILCSNRTGGTGGMIFKAASTGNIAGLTVIGNKILTDNASGTGVNFQGVSGGVISGNIVNGNQAGYTGILLDGVANTDLKFTGNTVGLGTSFTTTSPAAYGMFINNQAHNRISVTGNSLTGSTLPLSNASTAGAESVTWKDDQVKAFAKLPPCTSSLRGSTSVVNDSNTTTWGAVIAGGSSSHVGAACNDDSNWTVVSK